MIFDKMKVVLILHKSCWYLQISNRFKPEAAACTELGHERY